MSAKKHPSNSTLEFLNDTPILTSKRDLLNRSTYADALAARIINWNGQESLVIGLCGEWGCGKTSLKNLVTEQILAEESTIDILDLSPWQVSGHASITDLFFTELLLLLDDQEEPKSKNLANSVRTYSATMRFVGPLLTAIGGAFTSAHPVEGASVAAVGQTLSTSGKLAAEGAKIIDLAKNKPLSLIDQKRRVAAEMAKNERKILVVVDDIDRLTPIEVGEVFQLVKVNADFPNMIFILIFDYEVVRAYLDAKFVGRGRGYLEKIIQVMLHVPHTPRERIHEILIEGLTQIDNSLNFGECWDNYRWRELWRKGFRKYFDNVRNVYRVLSSFNFHLGQFRYARALEVNPLDLFALEILKIMEPDVYNQLVDEKDLLLDLRYNDGGQGSAQRERQKVDVEKILNCASDDARLSVQSILEMLFPKVFFSFGQNDESFLRDMRVCHSFFFDRYFNISLSQSDVSQSNVVDFIASLSDIRKLKKICSKSIREKTLGKTIRAVEANIEEVSVRRLEKIIKNLNEVGDDFPIPPDIFSVALDAYDCISPAARIIEKGLMTMPDKHQRFVVLKRAISQSKGYRIVLMLAIHERRDSDSFYNFILNDEDALELSRLACECIKRAAYLGRLEKHRDWAETMEVWRKWDLEEVKKWMDSRVSSAMDVLWLINSIMDTSQVAGKKLITRRRLNLGYFEIFMSLDKAKILLKNVRGERLSKTNELALKAFELAIENPDSKDAGYVIQN